MLGFEGAQLEIDRNETAQPPMKQQQVDVVVPVARCDPELAGDVTEVAPQLKQKTLKVVDECTLEIALAGDRAPFDAEELEHVRISELPDCRIGHDSLPASKREHRVAVFAKANALEKHAISLALELAHRPALLHAMDLVKRAPSHIIHSGKFE